MSSAKDPVKTKINELKSKTLLGQLPEDFLRITLNEQQLSEKQDNYIAQRLQYGQPQQSPMEQWRVPPRGRLNIIIVEARLAKNYGILSKMDPYVKITLGGKILETETDYGSGKNPRWNKSIAIYLPNNVDSFVLEIYDEKSFSSDEQVAVLNYTFQEELFQGVPLDEWLPLSGRLGEQKEGHIHLRIEFIPLEQLQRMHQAQARRPMSNQNLSAVPNYQLQNQVRQQQVLEAVEYTDADVLAIKEMFPSFDEDIVKSILEANNGHKENTINQLLAMS